MSKELTKNVANNVANTNSQHLTEQWQNGTLPQGWYYVKTPCEEIKKLYCGDGESLELDDPETAGYYFFHRDLNKGQVEVLAPVPDYMDCKRLMNDSIELDKAKIKIYELVSKTDELVQKIHILNEQNTKQYNELCEEIKKNNILEKQLEIATKALKEYAKGGSDAGNGCVYDTPAPSLAQKALKEMEEV